MIAARTAMREQVADPEHGPEFKRGWAAALEAAQYWHLAQAKQAMVQSTRTRFPKNLEREADVHRRAAERIVTLEPEP